MSTQPTYRPLVESLEKRDLPASGLQAYVSGGNLYVLGTAASDAITVNQSNNQLSVAGAKIGNAASVNASSIANVFIYGNGGNDTINLATVKINALVYGSTGNDTVVLGTGNDSVSNGGGFDWIYRPFNPSSPVVNGTSASDLHQGQTPLCQTGAALADAAAQGFNFANNIQYLGNDWYQVKLYGNLPSQRVYFDGWTNSGDQVEPASGEFWTVLMQRAREQAYGINPNQSYTLSQWNAFNAQSGGRLYSVAQAIYDFTGSTSNYTPVGNANALTLQAALARGDSVIAQSQANSYVSSAGIIGNHAYAVLSVYYDAGIWKVRLYNPWGIDGLNGSTIDALNPSQAAANDGFITLSWAQFTNSANFIGYFDAKRS
jgi:hypothetical protein